MDMFNAKKVKSKSHDHHDDINDSSPIDQGSIESSKKTNNLFKKSENAVDFNSFFEVPKKKTNGVSDIISESKRKKKNDKSNAKDKRKKTNHSIDQGSSEDDDSFDGSEFDSDEETEESDIETIESRIRSKDGLCRRVSLRKIKQSEIIELSSDESKEINSDEGSINLDSDLDVENKEEMTDEDFDSDDSFFDSDDSDNAVGYGVSDDESEEDYGDEED